MFRTSRRLPRASRRVALSAVAAAAALVALSACSSSAASTTHGLQTVTAGKITVAEVEEIVPVGSLDPDHIHTPGIFVKRLVTGTFEKRIEKRTVREN